MSNTVIVVMVQGQPVALTLDEARTLKALLTSGIAAATDTQMEQEEFVRTVSPREKGVWDADRWAKYKSPE